METYNTHALDKEGNTIEFLRDGHPRYFLSETLLPEDYAAPTSAAYRSRSRSSEHASYPDAFASSQKENIIPKDCCLRRTKYLTDIARARLSLHPEEVEGDASLPFFPCGGKDARRDRGFTHDQERTSQKISGQ
ncbi:MAG TPA: hypothetical protein VM870_07475 [Pyrinomonadaceae bacterium]|nr:hypothetical protein [Pyrinomonadaceae bacterium]